MFCVSTFVNWSIVAVAIALVQPNNPLQTLVAFGALGYVVTQALVPRLQHSFIKIGLKGKDMSKRGDPIEIAESMGVIPAVTYMMLMFLLIPFIFFKYLVSFSSLSNDSQITSNYSDQYLAVVNNRLFPHNKLSEFLSGLLSLQSITLLGLFDDLFDIRWRHKFFMPAIACVPLLIVYYVDFSVTSVVVPTFIQHKVWYGPQMLSILNWTIRQGNHVVTYLTGLSFSTLVTDYSVTTSDPLLLDLGIFYYAYMASISIFSPNAINILAGINGLEVGQSVVLGVIFLVNDLCYLFLLSVSQAAYDLHLLSAIFVIPFIGVSLGLLKYNWYPARVFVGDTYCYFSGMVFAVVGILGHFSKTLLIFLLPQIINFVYSAPQIFGLVPCPRHRLPRFDPESNLMHPSYATFKPRSWQAIALQVLEKLHLISIKRENHTIVDFSNMTLINLFLVWFGPMKENHLCTLLLATQFATGLAMLCVRHTVGPWIFGYDNLSWGVK